MVNSKLRLLFHELFLAALLDALLQTDVLPRSAAVIFTALLMLLFY